MNKDNKDNKEPGFTQNDLPKPEVFGKKEVYQYPQPADQGTPLKQEKNKGASSISHNEKEENKTSKQEGLNEESASGDAAAVEIFEDHAGEGD